MIGKTKLTRQVDLMGLLTGTGPKLKANGDCNRKVVVGNMFKIITYMVTDEVASTIFAEVKY